MSDGQHDIGATVREWTDVVRRSRFDKIVAGTHPGRFIKSSTVKTVALTMATYADANGRRVFPGIARLATDCEIGYNVASRCVTGLRDLGLIERVRRAVRRGARSEREKTDEYRLTLPEDLLERLTVPTPSDYLVIAARVAKPHRVTSQAHSETAVPSALYAGLDSAAEAESKYAFGTPTGESKYHIGTDLSAPQCAATYTQDLDTSNTSHSDSELDCQLTPTRMSEAESEDPNFEVAGKAPPPLRVVTGGGKTTPTVAALWPAAVPGQTPPQATPGAIARAELHRKLAARPRLTRRTA
jgi:hypothetical protein